jgi:HD-GYP domain-containing protein (c-di-GMP phosphodiesterase class II)
MNQGLYIGKQNDFIDRFTQSSAELRLLAKGDGTEVMFQTVRANETVFIEPGDVKETMEFFYILEGEIRIDTDNGQSIMKQGDYFYTNYLDKTVEFNTLTDVALLYISTQPLFGYISETIRDLTEIAKKVEKKDSYTHSHIQRVKDYAVKIGNRMGLSKEKNQNIVFASLLHDIGKINVPDEILKKPGRLTDEEFEYIKRHPGDGAEMVKKTSYEYIWQIIEQHHERLDGSGYPHGLKGNEILIEAKIIAVSDTYDAMTTDRPYRKGLSPIQTVEELKRLSGIHYEKEIVDVMVDILIEEGVIE